MLHRKHFRKFLPFDFIIHKICDCFVLLFGLWTIAANLSIQFNLSFSSLQLLSFAILPLGFILLRAVGGLSSRAALYSEELSEGGGYGCHLTKFIGLAISVALTSFYLITNYYAVYWCLTSVFMGGFYLAYLKSPEIRLCFSESESGDQILFIITAIVSVLFVLFINRPDPDDSLYINIATSVLDFPERPMLSTDSCHGISNGFCFPTYKVHSVELLSAFFSSIFGLEPIAVAHLILPPVFSFLSVCAASIFIRIFFPSKWGWAVFAWCIVLMLARETHWIYGNFAFVRMFQGKAVFVTMMIPLIITYAIEFYTLPSVNRWALLAFAQIAATGLSGNALYGAPLTAVLALVGCFRPNRRSLFRMGMGFTASVYPLMLALVVKREISQKMLDINQIGEFSPIEDVIGQFFGHGGSLFVWLVTISGLWTIYRDPARRQWMLGFAFIFFSMFMNPFLDRFWAENMTAVHIVWRLFWILPLPLWLAIAIVFPIRHNTLKGRAKNGYLVSAVAAIILLCIMHRSFNNPGYGGLKLGKPSLKVPDSAYRTAELVSDLLNKGEYVLASEDVATYITTFRNSPFPLVARRMYAEVELNVYPVWINASDTKERLVLFDYASGYKYQKRIESLLSKWMRKVPLMAVVVPEGLNWHSELAGLLSKWGFISGGFRGYTLFYRGTEWPSKIAPLIDNR